jgi:hypothetical protein
MYRTKNTSGKLVRGTNLIVKIDPYENNYLVTTTYSNGLKEEATAFTLREAEQLRSNIYKIASLTKSPEIVSLIAEGAISFNAAREIVEQIALMHQVEHKRYGT